VAAQYYAQPVQQSTGQWLPDPIGDYDLRWWTGTVWTDDVCTGRFVTRAAVAAVPIPAVETVLWGNGRDWFSTHGVHFAATVELEATVVPWWAVAKVSVAEPSSLQLTTEYPGYTGKAAWLLSGADDADMFKAICTAWSRRHRRAMGLAA
jgi:hypothetical protein